MHRRKTCHEQNIILYDMLHVVSIRKTWCCFLVMYIFIYTYTYIHLYTLHTSMFLLNSTVLGAAMAWVPANCGQGYGQGFGKCGGRVREYYQPEVAVRSGKFRKGSRNILGRGSPTWGCWNRLHSARKGFRYSRIQKTAQWILFLT